MSTAHLWTGAEALAATSGSGPSDWVADGVSIDSRTLRAGELFVALAGPSFDGHDFVAAALERGAPAALVHRRPEGLAEDAPLLLVEDTLEGLRALGRAGRTRSRGRIIGLTGSAGKTGTKEALKTCLSAQASCFASAGSLNNHWGVPLSLARLPQSAAYGVFEMGMNHAGEIRELTALVRPEVAIITNIGVAHLEFFDSQDGIADAKAEIFEGMGPNGIAVLPRDDAFFERLQASAERAGVTRVLGFGRHPAAEARLLDVQLHATCSAVRADICGTTLDYCLALPGEHWVINSLAVLAAVRGAGGDVGAAAAALSRLHPMKGRGARGKINLPAGGTVTLIDESYNANPLSVRAALAVLARAKTGPGGRRIAVLGEMLELGDEAGRMHAELADAVAEEDIDLVFTCAGEMAHLAEALPRQRLGAHGADSRQLVAPLLETLAPGDVVLVKGSLGSRMAVIVDALEGLRPCLPRAVNGNL